MRLGIDLDGCLADFNTAYTKLLINIKGEDFFPPDRNSDNFPKIWHYEREYGYTDVEAVAWDQITKSDTFWFDLPEMPRANEAIQILNAINLSGHAVYFITHRSGNDVKMQSEDWLVQRGMLNPTVLIAGDKIPIIKALGLDFYIDDKPEMIVDIDTYCIPKHLFIKDAPYNRGLGLRHAKRVPTVYDALVGVFDVRQGS